MHSVITALKLHGHTHGIPVVQLESEPRWYFVQGGIHIPLIEKSTRFGMSFIETSQEALEAGFPDLGGIV